MGAKTGIEWTDSTWSPIRFRVKADAAEIARARGYTSLVQIAEKMVGRVGSHCEHVSPGCEHCYAATNNHRCLPANGTGLPYDRRSRDLVEAFVDEKALLQPLKWRPILTGIENAEEQLFWVRDGSITVTRQRSRRIFVENQSDLFGEWVTDEMLDRVFAIMALCPQHTFQVLTKRPERMIAYLYRACGRIADRIMAMRKDCGDTGCVGPLPHIAPGAAWWPLANVWLGVSVENQATADERIPLLLQTPAAVRFISAEPLLGDIQIPEYLPNNLWANLSTWKQPELDWVICGGESGPGARPMHPDWARSLRDQCAAAGVAFFMKQMGADVRETIANCNEWPTGVKLRTEDCASYMRPNISDKKGGDWNEWPSDLRVRQMPEASHA